MGHKTMFRLLAAAVALLIVTPSAHAIDVRRVPGTHDIVTNADTGKVAYLRKQGALVVRNRRRVLRRLEIPKNCNPAAISASAVGLDCFGYGSRPVLLDLRTGKLRLVPMDGSQPMGLGVVALGERWMQVQADGPPQSGGHYDVWTVLLNIRSGQAIDLREDPFGADHVIDLDRKRPARKLCAGLQRSPGSDYDLSDRSRFAPALFRGGYFADSATRILSRCDSPRAVAFGDEPITLNSRFFAFYGLSEVHLRRLESGRERTFALQFGAGRLSRDALWLWGRNSIRRPN